MVDILHRVGPKTPPADVYAALTTLEGLRGWWTQDTSGDAGTGGVVRFRFGGEPEPDGFDMSVLEAVPDKLVLWQVVAGPEEWLDTRIRFELSHEDGFTIILFEHTGWREPVEFMNHCSTRWATYLMSLLRFVETGTGEPYPHDVRISNWK
jgi:uncharacterized protein YndB with AHSA1/START domain